MGCYKTNRTKGARVAECYSVVGGCHKVAVLWVNVVDEKMAQALMGPWYEGFAFETTKGSQIFLFGRSVGSKMIESVLHSKMPHEESRKMSL